MINYGTKEIVKTILEKIKNKDFKENDKLLSEKQLSIKYNVSRIVATRVYQELLKLGAIYSIQRQGYFVTPNLANIFKSLIDEYKITKIEDNVELIPFSNFIGKKLLNSNYFSFSRNYYRDKELIIQSQNWLDLRINYQLNITELKTNFENFTIVSTVTFLKFEKINVFKQKVNLVNYRVSYSNDGKVVWLTKFIINPKYFKFVTQQFNI